MKTKYLIPYDNSNNVIQRYIFGNFDIKNRDDKIVIGYYIHANAKHNEYVVYYGRSYDKWKSFNHLEEAKQFLDEQLIKMGCILLTENQYQKLKVLL
jgi:hypothetical protein